MGFFDFISSIKDKVGDVYSRVKDTAQNVYNTLHSTAQKWLEGEYHAPDFVGGGVYRYCGPGTKLDTAGQPINVVDSACREHDLDYDRLGRQKGTLSSSEFNRLVRESDQRLINAIDRSGQSDLGAKLSKYGIVAKNKLEDWGLINPSLFI